jgi:hypothetical protein
MKSHRKAPKRMTRLREVEQRLNKEKALRTKRTLYMKVHALHVRYIRSSLAAGEYEMPPQSYRDSRLKKKMLRKQGWHPPEVTEAYERLKDGGSLKVASLPDAIGAAGKQIVYLLGRHDMPSPVWRFHSSKSHARLRFDREQRYTRTLEAMVRAVAPDPKDIVVMGDWFGRRALKGETMSAPVRSFRRFLAQRRRVLVMDEYNTSCKCSTCRNCDLEAKVEHPKRPRVLSKYQHKRRCAAYERVHGVPPRKPDISSFSPVFEGTEGEWTEAFEEKHGRKPSSHEISSMYSENVRSASMISALKEEFKKQWGKVPFEGTIPRRMMRESHGTSHCPQCKTTWRRDVNAGFNFAYGFYYMITSDSKERPPYLSRPFMSASPFGAGGTGESLSRTPSFP